MTTGRSPGPSAGEASEPKHFSDDFATKKQQKQDQLRQRVLSARLQFSHWQDGTLIRNRILSYDSTFGLSPTRALTLHNAGVQGTVSSRPAVRMSDDTLPWWFPSDEHTGN